MAGVAGLEPVTSAVTGQRSNQLSYTPAKGNVKLRNVESDVKFWFGFFTLSRSFEFSNQLIYILIIKVWMVPLSRHFVAPAFITTQLL